MADNIFEIILKVNIIVWGFFCFCCFFCIIRLKKASPAKKGHRERKVLNCQDFSLGLVSHTHAHMKVLFKGTAEGPSL